MNGPRHSLLYPSLVVLSVLCAAGPLGGQVRGDEAELERLVGKAEDAMANDDPDGAASMMGRAGLLAAQLSKRHDGWKAGWYKGREALFRAQEHTYRGMALFKRAGGELPASSGVCGSFALAYTSLRHTTDEPPAASSEPQARAESDRLHAAASHWHTVLDGLVADYQCP